MESMKVTILTFIVTSGVLLLVFYPMWCILKNIGCCTNTACRECGSTNIKNYHGRVDGVDVKGCKCFKCGHDWSDGSGYEAIEQRGTFFKLPASTKNEVKEYKYP